MLHRDGTIRPEFTDRRCSPNSTTTTRTAYSPRFVSEILSPNIVCSPRNSNTSNCSRGDDTKNVFMFKIYYAEACRNMILRVPNRPIWYSVLACTTEIGKSCRILKIRCSIISLPFYWSV